MGTQNDDEEKKHELLGQIRKVIGEEYANKIEGLTLEEILDKIGGDIDHLLNAVNESLF